MKTFKITIQDDKRNTLFSYNVEAESEFNAHQKGRAIIAKTNDKRATYYVIEQLTF